MARNTVQVLIEAGMKINANGEKISPGETYEPHMAQTGPLYSCVASGSAIAHVKVGQ